MKHRKIILLLAIVAVLTAMTGSALAISESEVQTAIANSSREQVSGNIFIWFLCAIAFLKISQKIDSFMASLGINVGRTGGSMLAEMMIAGRALAGGMGAAGQGIANFFGHGNASGAAGGGGAQPAAGTPFSGGGGLAAHIHNAAGNAATASATGRGSGLGSALGGAMFNSSLSKGGKFGTDVTRAVALGSIASVGTMKGTKAAQALSGYLGYSQAGGPEQAAGVSQNGPSGVPDTPVVPEETEDTVTLSGGAAAGAPSTPKDVPTEPVNTGDTITLDGGAAPDSILPSPEVDTQREQVNPGASPTTEGPSASVPPSPDSVGKAQPTTQQPTTTQPPTFSHVEIGGGRITGYETPAGGGEARQFAMYNANQYMEPTGDYEMVQTVDGESWYKQYAVPTVQKTPKEVTDRGVVYDEKIVQQLPQIPKRKDKV